MVGEVLDPSIGVIVLDLSAVSATDSRADVETTIASVVSVSRGLEKPIVVVAVEEVYSISRAVDESVDGYVFPDHIEGMLATQVLFAEKAKARAISSSAAHAQRYARGIYSEALEAHDVSRVQQVTHELGTGLTGETAKRQSVRVCADLGAMDSSEMDENLLELPRSWMGIPFVKRFGTWYTILFVMQSPRNLNPFGWKSSAMFHRVKRASCFAIEALECCPSIRSGFSTAAFVDVMLHRQRCCAGRAWG